MIVVADTSVLINLCRVGQSGLFRKLFQEVVIPPEVAAEFARLTGGTPRFAGLKLPDGIRQQSPLALLPAVRAAAGLESGEVAALSLAVEIHADAVLVDERRAHEVAIQLGLRVIGILAILLRRSLRVSGFPNRCGNRFSKLLAKAHSATVRSLFSARRQQQTMRLVLWRTGRPVISLDRLWQC